MFSLLITLSLIIGHRTVEARPPLIPGPKSPTALFWRPAGSNDPQVIYLMYPKVCHGTYCDPEKVVGGWHTVDQIYRTWDGKTWSDVTDPPIPPPKPAGRPNFGVDDLKGHDPGQTQPLPNDKDKPRLTSIGCTIASSVFPKELADKVLYQAYQPDNWAVQAPEFKKYKQPCVLLQDPTGKVLIAFESVSGGLPKDWAAQCMQLIRPFPRKPVDPPKPITPPVDPPDDFPLPILVPPETPEPPLANPSPEIPNSVLVTGGIALLLFLLWRRK